METCSELTISKRITPQKFPGKQFISNRVNALKGK
uniref:Uncharacterized protein n=1 Tax=Arundo donax TaxID=35708 RepID=A0A0A8YM84_ARUDO